MTANHHVFPPFVPVAPPSHLSTPSPAIKEASPILWHNELRDLTASLLTKVCHEFSVQPDLQPQARTQGGGGGGLGVTRNPPLKLMIFIKGVFSEENGKLWF